MVELCAVLKNNAQTYADSGYSAYSLGTGEIGSSQLELTVTGGNCKKINDYSDNEKKKHGGWKLLEPIIEND